MAAPSDDLSRLLLAAGAGDSNAAEAVVPLVYDELKAMARARLRQAEPGATLQATVLVHDVAMKLFGGSARFEGRKHFFFAAGRAMKDVLCERARKRARREGHRPAIEANARERVADAQRAEESADLILAVNEALPRLRAHDQRAHDVVILRFFAGLSIEQIAEMLEVTSRTVDRDWKFARSWLYAELRAGAALADVATIVAGGERDADEDGAEA